MRTTVLLVLLLAACTKEEPAPTAGSSGASRATESDTARLDIDDFCEKALGVGRPCQGDDEIIEGNKIGLCTTTLRDSGVSLDATRAPACLAAIDKGKPLPDLRTLELLVARFGPCRELLAPIEALSKVQPRSAGQAAAGETCGTSADCKHGHFCDSSEAAKACAAQKKAGQPCSKNEECLGRCSAQAGRTCVSYCGSG